MNGTHDHRAPQMKTLEDVIAWIHRHSGEIDTLWRFQHKFNDDYETQTMRCQTSVQAEMKELREEVRKIRNRLFWMMGAASTLGAVLANIGETVFNGALK